MKLTRPKLRELVEQELGRMRLGQSGASSLEIADAAEQDILGALSELDELYKMVKSAHSVAKADPSVPEHVVRTFSSIAAKVAAMLEEH